MGEENTQSARRILVIEDCDEDFDTIKEAMRRAGRPEILERALTGDDGLELLGTNAPLGRLPSLILLDLNTPGSDGRYALKAIRSKPFLRAIPVIVFSTSSNPRDIQGCYDIGADAYHIKPFDFTEHLSLLDHIFARWLDGAAPPVGRRP